MSEPKFTPAPWIWHTSNSWKRLKREDHGISMNVLEPFVHRRDHHPDCTVSDEDMALIAAAPELYAALADLIEEIETDGGVDTSCWPILDAGKAALAKARGES